MTISNKSDLINDTVARVVNNAPVSELLRVYAESLKVHIENLSEEQLVESLQNAGYTDLIEQYFTEDTEDSAQQ
jgi:hypothetical protein